MAMGDTLASGLPPPPPPGPYDLVNAAHRAIDELARGLTDLAVSHKQKDQTIGQLRADLDMYREMVELSGLRESKLEARLEACHEMAPHKEEPEHE